MCGIIGAASSRNVGKLLVQGLHKMEYRGYDSAGIALHQKDSIFNLRTLGKVSLLEDGMIEQRPKSKLGIAHTRWATHGGVSTANAHPHVASDRVSIVHNGIVENHREIRQRLEGAGHQFSSNTDSEVLAHLFVEAFDSGMEPVAATQQVLAQIEGAYAFAVMAIDYPEILIVARNASPLAWGIGDDACYIGSDAIALSHLTRKVIYLKAVSYTHLTLPTKA